jgi:hypothetical protein
MKWITSSQLLEGVVIMKNVKKAVMIILACCLIQFGFGGCANTCTEFPSTGGTDSSIGWSGTALIESGILELKYDEIQFEISAEDLTLDALADKERIQREFSELIEKKVFFEFDNSQPFIPGTLAVSFLDVTPRAFEIVTHFINKSG